MKRKNILAGISACAVTISAMAFSASAAITNSTAAEKDSIMLDCKNLDCDNIYGIKADIVFDGDIEGGTNGGLAFNGDKNKGTDWNDFKWAFEAGGKKKDDSTDSKVTIEDNGNKSYTISVITDKAYLANSKDWEYAQIFICSWGGTDFAVTKLAAIDKDGKELGAFTDVALSVAKTTASSAAADTTTTTAAETTTSAAASTTSAAASSKASTTAAGTTKKEDATKAGDPGVAAAVAGLTAGAAAMILTRRKKH